MRGNNRRMTPQHQHRFHPTPPFCGEFRPWEKGTVIAAEPVQRRNGLRRPRNSQELRCSSGTIAQPSRKLCAGRCFTCTSNATAGNAPADQGEAAITQAARAAKRSACSRSPDGTSWQSVTAFRSRRQVLRR